MEPHTPRRRQRLKALLLPLALAACAPSIEPTSATLQSASGSGVPIVFIPGIKGSALADGSGTQAYLTRPQALGLDTPNLALPVRFDGVTQARDGLIANGIMRELYVIPKLLGEDIYGPWLDALKDSGRPVYLFAYDWRRDNLETLDALSRFVHDVRALHNSRVQLVGHSMGGMLAMALANRDSDDLASLTCAGSPLRGGIGFLPDLQVGVPVGRNDAMLSPNVLATFPSVYGFFSTTVGDGVDDPTMNFYEPAAWKRAKLGPYAHDTSVDFDRYFAIAIEHAAEFRGLVDSEPNLDIPITIVAGDSTPTLVAIHRIDGAWSFDDVTREPGDGRVPLERARPRRHTHKLLTTQEGHGTLLNDPDISRAILAGP